MDVKLPRLGEGADSGTIASVFVKVGDKVSKDQPLLELESEKAVASIPSPTSGTVTRIHVKEGDLIKVGQVLCSMDEGEGPAAAPPHPREEIEESEAQPAAHAEEETPGEATEGAGEREGAEEVEEIEMAHTQELDVPAPTANRVAPAASPSLRKVARDLGIDLTRVRGSERGGRIVTADLKRYIQHLEQLAAQARRGAPSKGAPAAPQPAPQRPAPQPIDFARWGPVHTQKLSTIRRTISTRMAESWTTIPHVTQFDQADVTDVMKLRKKYAARYEKKKAHLTVTPFLLKAVVKTLQAYPIFNASLDEANGEVVYKDYYHIGIAVDTEQGLIVPVIRDVDKKSLFDLSAELQQLAERTRDRKVSLDEMQGGTFTISNQGGIGSGFFTPIINRPEVAILGVARGTEQMVFKKTRFVRRSILPISLSYDHRIIDGADAARFMVALVKNIESTNEKDVKI